MARKPMSFYKLTPAVIKKVERLASRGLNLRQIARSMGWSEDFIHRKKKESKELDEAIKKGIVSGLEKVTSSLFKKATGFHHTESHFEDDGKGGKKLTKEIKKYTPPDTTAIIFYTTNRDPENWKHKNEQTVKGDVNLKVGKIKDSDVRRVNDLFENIIDKG